MTFSEVHTDKSKTVERAVNAARCNNFSVSLSKQKLRFIEYIQKDIEKHRAIGISTKTLDRACRSAYGRSLCQIMNGYMY